jgi:nicotinamide N-methyltransferase
MSRASSPLSDAGSTDLSLFTEPASFRPATPPPSTAHFTLPPAPPSLGLSSADGAAQDILLHLVGAHPLWGHHLWNAAPVLSRFLNAHAPTLLAQRSVLELGAAAGLPCVVARKRGAATTVASDWPDIELLANLRRNVEAVGGIAEVRSSLLSCCACGGG